MSSNDHENDVQHTYYITLEDYDVMKCFIKKTVNTYTVSKNSITKFAKFVRWALHTFQQLFDALTSYKFLWKNFKSL